MSRWGIPGESRDGGRVAPKLTIVRCSDPAAKQPKFLDWLKAHDLNPRQIHTVEIVEVTVTDAPKEIFPPCGYMIVHGYAVDARGSKYVEPDGRGGAEFKPFLVELKSAPPAFVGTRFAQLSRPEPIAQAA